MTPEQAEDRRLALHRTMNDAKSALAALDPYKPFLAQLEEELIDIAFREQEDVDADVVKLGELIGAGLNMLMKQAESLTESYGEIRLTTRVGSLCYDPENSEWYFMDQR